MLWFSETCPICQHPSGAGKFRTAWGIQALPPQCFLEKDLHLSCSDSKKSLGMQLYKAFKAFLLFYSNFMWNISSKFFFNLAFTPSISILQIFPLRSYSVFRIRYAETCTGYICFHLSQLRSALFSLSMPDLSLCFCYFSSLTKFSIQYHLWV